MSWLNSNEEKPYIHGKYVITPNKYGEFYINNLRFTTCDEFC